jgi:hypothetical protein
MILRQPWHTGALSHPNCMRVNYRAPSAINPEYKAFVATGFIDHTKSKCRLPEIKSTIEDFKNMLKMRAQVLMVLNCMPPMVIYFTKFF